MEIRRNKEKEYWAMKQQWQSFTQEQENRFTKWREAKVLISEFHSSLLAVSPYLHLNFTPYFLTTPSPFLTPLLLTILNLITFTTPPLSPQHMHTPISPLLDKDVLRTDRELDAFKATDSHKLIQLEDILRTYIMYNFDLGTCS